MSLELGRRMPTAGVIDRPDDVFLLTQDELKETAIQLPD
jgi:hypothetical protein